MPTQTTEQHADWIVGCATAANGAKHCSMWQQLSEEKTKRQVLRFELAAAKDGNHIVRVDLPFGISIREGAFVLVNGLTSYTVMILSCFPPRGCVGEFSLPGKDEQALRQATTIGVTFKAFNEGEDPAKAAPLTFNLSIKGFAEALDRLAVMAK